MHEEFDQARSIVYYLRREGFEVRLDGGVVDVTPMSKLKDSQRRMLSDRLDEVARFLACEYLVDHFLYVRAGGC